MAVKVSWDIIIVDFIEEDKDESEADIDNNEYEEESTNISSYIGDANQHWASLAPHQPSLSQSQKSNRHPKGPNYRTSKRKHIFFQLAPNSALTKKKPDKSEDDSIEKSLIC